MDDLDTILTNFHTNDEKLSRLYELRLSHIHDLAELLAPLGTSSAVDASDDGSDAEGDPMFTAFSAFREELDRFRARILRQVGAHGREFVGHMLDGCSARSLAELSLAIAQKKGFCPHGLEIKPIEHADIACFPTPQSELASRAFSRELTASAVSTVESFAAACEGVYSGRFDFCVMPAHGVEEGLLLPFFRLAERYELKSVLSCDIRQGDETKSTFYLYGSRLAYCDGFDRMDVCLHILPDKLYTVLDGLHQLGVVCESLTSLPYSIYCEDTSMVRLYFGRVDPISVILYLALAVPAFTVCGIYKRLIAVTHEIIE